MYSLWNVFVFSHLALLFIMRLYKWVLDVCKSFVAGGWAHLPWQHNRSQWKVKCYLPMDILTLMGWGKWICHSYFQGNYRKTILFSLLCFFLIFSLLTHPPLSLTQALKIPLSLCPSFICYSLSLLKSNPNNVFPYIVHPLNH